MSTSSQNEPAQTQAPMPPERLAEISARLSAEGLTPGPWTLDYESCDCSDGLCRHGCYVAAVITSEVKSIAAERIERTGEAPRDYDFHRTEMPDFTDADWELMAHAREDTPALLAEVDRQAREIERLTAELAKYVGHEPTLAEEAQYRHEAQVRYAAALEAQICQCEPQCEGGEYLHAADCPVVPIQMQAFDAAGGAR